MWVALLTSLCLASKSAMKTLILISINISAQFSPGDQRLLSVTLQGQSSLMDFSGTVLAGITPALLAYVGEGSC